MDLTASIAGIKLEHPVMNAAGTCKTLDDVKKLAPSNVAAIVLGSITVEQRDGNPEPRFDPSGLNALGLPNNGYEYYKELLPEMVRIAHEAAKPFGVSLAGSKPEEYGALTKLACEAGVDFVEVNLGCPNEWQGGKQKRIACFDLLLTQKILIAVANACSVSCRILVKVSPISDPYYIQELAKLFSQSFVQGVVAVNTFPNGYDFDVRTGSPNISVGYAGVSGQDMFRIGLGQTRQWREHLTSSIGIIAAGGISSGVHARKYLELDATAVQLATAYWRGNENPRVFTDVLDGLIETYQEV